MNLNANWRKSLTNEVRVCFHIFAGTAILYVVSHQLNVEIHSHSFSERISPLIIYGMIISTINVDFKFFLSAPF